MNIRRKLASAVLAVMLGGGAPLALIPPAEAAGTTPIAYAVRCPCLSRYMAANSTTVGHSPFGNQP
ncbi:MAG: hypothetical protein ACRD0K_07890 [Egibacteraceae bacterium]